MSDIPPLKLPTCGLYKIKKTSSFYLHPGGLNILQAPSLLGWTPAQPMTSSASMVWGLVGGGPGVGGPLHRKVLSLPYCLQWFLPRSCRFGQLAARVLMSSGLRMALLLSHWKMVRQLRQLSFKLMKDGWVCFYIFQWPPRMVLALRSKVNKLYRLKHTQRKSEQVSSEPVRIQWIYLYQ